MQNTSFERCFLEDWGLKLIALVITLGLWFGVTGLSTPTTKRLTVPLNLSISNNAEITNAPQQDVDIVISGDKRKIDQINKSDLAATLDLTDVTPGDRVVSLSPDNVYVPLPQGIKLIEVQPGRIAVNLEAVEEKEIEVKAQTVGNPAAGYEVYSMSVITAKDPRPRAGELYKNARISSRPTRSTSPAKSREFTAAKMPVSVANPKAAVLNTVVDVYFRIGEKRVERVFSLPVSGPHKNSYLC